MKLVPVDGLKEGDLLARDVFKDEFTILLAQGTEITNEYIEKLKELSIATVYIEDAKEKEEFTAHHKMENTVDNNTVDRAKNSDQYEAESKEQAKEDVDTSLPEPIKEKQSIVQTGKDRIQQKKKQIKISVEEIKILRDDVEQKIKTKVKDILELHVYQHTDGLEQLAETAQNIITDILEEQAVMEKVYDVKERSADIYEHSLTTCTIATLVALKLNMTEKEVYDISVSALIHDLGLRYLVIRYENQDIHFLPVKEQEEYKKHTIYAYTAIKNENWVSEEAKEMILNHHERKDGSGYPLGTDLISRPCQVLGICDEFDEMICGIGKARVRVHEAINCIRNYSGIWFDEDIVQNFLQMIAVYPVGSMVLTNTGLKAIVIRQNNHFPERPVLRVVENQHGQEVTEEVMIDLIKNTSVVIQSVLK